MGRSQQLPRDGGVGRDASAPPADDTGCRILHVDMDAFYASVEVRARPELRGTPVIVGGTGPRGVVSSATYDARAFGVRSAMPMTRARRLCPQAVVLPPDFAAYTEVSRGVMAIFQSVTPLVEPLSLDEAFLDVRGALRRLGPPTQIGEWIRGRVADEQGVTCSVGVAPTKFLAKLASTLCKPDGLRVVPVDGALEFLHPLPVGALWGVGERSAEHLHRMGLTTVGDIARTPLDTLRRALGPAMAAHLHGLANGIDDRDVTPHGVDKSIGAEETFDTDVEDHRVIHQELLRLSQRTAGRLRGSHQVARTISVKVRFADFRTITRAQTLDTPTDAGQEIYLTARALFDALRFDRPRIRLVGVRAEGLAKAEHAPVQLRLDAREHGWRDADRAVDLATSRFGPNAVRPATLMPEPRTRETGSDSVGGRP